MQDPDRKPRVLVLASTFPRWNSDNEPRFVFDLCRQLLPNFDILVLAPHAPGAAREEWLDSVHVQRFRYFLPRWQAVTYEGGIIARLRDKPWRVLQLPFFFIALCWTTWRLYRRWKPDVIHAHWIVPQGLAACMSCGTRMPILCTSHGGDLYSLRGYVFRRIKSWVLSRCSAATVVSDSMVDELQLLAPGIRVEVAPMGTDLSAQFTPPSSFDSRSDNEILFVGRLVEKKGLRYLLEAFARLYRDSPGLKLTIAGDGPLRNDLQRQAISLGIEHAVQFLGSLPHDDLPEVYRQATLAVYPFVVARDGDQEGFGLVIVEAMGCGCPVIASDLPAVRQSIEPGVTGMLVQPGDPLALEDAIRQCLEDPSRRSRLAASALHAVQQRFDWPAAAQRYSSLLNDLIQA